MDIQTYLKKYLLEGDADPRLFGEKILLEEPHKKQVGLIGLDDKLNLVITGNRFGKTRGLAQKHIYRCWYKVGLPLGEMDEQTWENAEYKTLNCSFEYKQASKVFNNIERLYNQSPYFQCLVKRISRADRVIEFINNSEFHFASLEEGGKHAEAEKFYYISVDEAGWQKGLRNIYLNVLLPRQLGIKGVIDFAGTPKPESDPWLEEMWFKAKTGTDGVSWFQGSTYDNPYLSTEEIDELEKKYEDYPHLKRMVLFGEFVPRLGKLLSTSQLQNAIDENLPATPDARRIMWGTIPAEGGHRYASFWDLAFEEDWTVGITLDVSQTPYVQVNYTRVNKGNVGSWNEIFNLMDEECERYNLPYVYYDATTPTGGSLQETLDEKEISARPLRITSGGKEFDGQTISKDELINNLELAFCWRQPIFDDQGKLLDGDTTWGKIRIPPIRQEIDELAMYHRDDKKIPHTDSVIALAGAVTIAEEEATPIRAGYRDVADCVRQERSWFANPAFMNEEKELEEAKKPIRPKLSLLRGR